MAWNLWVVTKERVRLFVAQYASQNEARFFMFAWWERGFFPVKHDPVDAEITVPNNSLLFAFTEETTDPPPSQTVGPSTSWKE